MRRTIHFSAAILLIASTLPTTEANSVSRWFESTYNSAKSAVTKIGPSLRGSNKAVASTETPTISLDTVLTLLREQESSTPSTTNQLDAVLNLLLQPPTPEQLTFYPTIKDHTNKFIPLPGVQWPLTASTMSGHDEPSEGETGLIFQPMFVPPPSGHK